MRFNLAMSALAVAALFEPTAIASAQNQPAPGASSEGNVGPGVTNPRMGSGKMKSTRTRSGTTTGMSGHSHRGNKAAKSSESK